MIRSPDAEKSVAERSSAAVKPLKPMLAFPVADIAEAFATLAQSFPRAQA